MDSSEVILPRLQSSRTRFTKIRVEILDIFSKPHSPLSAGEILGLVQRKHPGVNKTTVYRQLEFLKKNLFLEEVDFQEGQKRYELLHNNHHHHLICTKCRKIEHIEVENVERELHLSTKILEQNKLFKILSHRLEFFGLCRNCQNF